MTFAALATEVVAHLQEVVDDPSRSLNNSLLESIDRQVTEAIDESDRDALLNQLSKLLPTLQQDPTQITSLIDRLISPTTYTFSRVLSINPPVDFLAGLTVASAPVNCTTLGLLRKAKYSIGDVGVVAGKAEVVGALIRLWLCTQVTAVAGLAQEVILDLLCAEARTEASIELMGKGLMWRRIFRDRDVYGSIYSICSLTTAGQDGQPSRRDKTVAQARLLDMILKIDSDAVRISQIRDIEQQYGVNDGGLLEFAAMHMVDYREDVLMHVNLLDFYAMFLSGKQKIIPEHPEKDTTQTLQASTFSLEFLRKCQVHDRSLTYYLYPDGQDPVDVSFLYCRSANYLSTWCSTYPGDFLGQPTKVEATLARLLRVFQNMSSGYWAQGKAPKDDLHVLASLPRVALIPRPRSSSPLLLIPTTPANADAFRTLAYIFTGNRDTASGGNSTEDMAARVLYYLYMDHSPNFWHHVVSAAETIALKDVALAALSLMAAIITAHWAPLPTTPSSHSSFTLPTERALADKCHAPSLPASGIEAIMTEPAIGVVVPYLIRPAQTFSNLVGGGRGDVESAAYKVAIAKHETLIQLYKQLKQWMGSHPEAQEMMATVERRINQGPMGGTSEVGGRVGTMEL